MVAMSASDTCDVIDPTYDAASLRKYEGLTVRLPVFCKQSSVLTKSRSKNSGRSKTCTNTQLPEYSSSNNEQMTDSAVCDDIRERHAELCYSNCHRVGSALSCLIRQRLLSPFAPPQASFSPSSVSRRPTHLLTIAILLLTLHSVLTTTLASSIAKVPLTRTDATALDGFRKFKGLGPNVKRDGKGPSVVSPRSNFISKYFRLDFQTLKVIKRWGSHNDLLLVGGRDYIYMINATLGDGPIRYLERLKWESSVESRRACRQMGKQKHECNNFLRVIELLEDDRLYVCGTNSYEPTCRYYSRENFPFLSQDSRSNSNYDDEVVCRGQCECPYNPLTSSTNLYTNTSSGFQLFTAVINDFMGKKPVLMRKSDSYVYSVEKWFNDPTFIKMVDSDDGKVYLFFRETATTVETGSSLQMTYARVAQVCKNDTGGTTVLRFQWSTFLKARLKCSLPGSDRGADFNFDNLTSVSEVTRVVGSDGRAKDVIFATFTTPWDWNAVAMSAVCVYSMDDIRSLFESGSFLGKQELHSRTDDTSDYLDRATGIKTLIKAIPVPQREVPVPRPGRCSSPTSATNDKTLYFAKDHFLMYDPVMPLDGQPVYIGETDLRATQITVDADTSDESARMVYVGTEDGRILRLRPRLRFNTGPKALLLEEMRVANEKKCTSGRLQCGVLALHVSRPASDSSDPAGANLNLWPSIFVAFTDRLTQVPLSGCKQYVNYECCNVDPDCGWLDEKCIPRTAQNSRQLPAISTMADLPTNCQAQAEPRNKDTGDVNDDDDDDDLEAASVNGYIVAAGVAFLCGVLFSFCTVFLFHRHRRSHATHSISKPTPGRYKSMERLDDPEQGQEPTKSPTPYFVIDRRSDSVAHAERPTSLVHGIMEDKSRPEYTPLTPSSIDDKDFGLKENIRVEAPPVEDGDEGVTSMDNEASAPLLDRAKETALIDDIKAAISAAKLDKQAIPFADDTNDPPIVQHEPISQEKANLDQLEAATGEPPKLPPKQSSLKKTKLPPQLPPLESPPATGNSNNTNNNNSQRGGHTPSFATDLPPPPPPVPTEEYSPEENIVRTKSPPPKSPPPKKPPPPRPKSGLRKHKTFSAPHNQKIKPPVPPKSSSVMRSSSLRLPPPPVDVVSSLSKNNQVASASLPFSGDSNFHSLGKGSLIRRGRTPSYKHSSMNRPKSKGLVAVATPVVPPSE